MQVDESTVRTREARRARVAHHAPNLPPSKHIFVGSKAPWFEITDELPQYDEYPT